MIRGSNDGTLRVRRPGYASPALRGGLLGGRWRRGTDDADGRDEAVTLATYRDDVGAVARALVEQLAQHVHMLREIAVADGRIGPNVSAIVSLSMTFPLA